MLNKSYGMRKRLVQRDVFSGLFFVALSGVLWSLTSTFPQLENGYPGPALFPQIIAVLLGILGVYLGSRAILSKNSSFKTAPKKASEGKIVRLATGILLVSAYPFLVNHVHFIPAMAGLILFFGLILNNKPWQAMLTAVLSAGLIYALFTQLLGVPL